MNPIARAFAGAAACLALLGLCALVGPGTAYPQEPNVQDVRVVNPAVDPVLARVDGKVCIDPACNTVTVGNTLNNPVLVRVLPTPTGEPFQLVTGWSLIAGRVTGGGIIYTVPDGRQLLVEHVSALADVPRRQKVSLRLLAEAFRSLTRIAFHALDMRHQGTFFDRDTFHSSETARLRVAPGMALTLLLRRDGGDSFATGEITVSGVLVDP
jgi:hypothetical protein